MQWTGNKLLTLLLASTAVLGTFFVVWDQPDQFGVTVHEEVTGVGGDMDGSLYAQQGKLYDAVLSDNAQDDVIADTAVQDKVPEVAEVQVAEDWKAERESVWSTDQATLKASDKHMYAALKAELADEDSAQWPRYLRYKGIHPPAAKGHKWTNSGNKEVIGSLLETKSSEALCDKKVSQKHGYFKLSGGTDKEYFYWLFEARDAKPEDAPLVMWLTGGPGCSSELALFTENGPCSVNEAGTGTKDNAFSWNRKANLIFLDQPAGTGFSFGKNRDTDYDKNEDGVSTDLYHFMQELVKTYPKYHKNDFYLFGESYAGHFIPASAAAIQKGNMAKTGEFVALKGVGIGNGLTNPEVQYPYYPQMAFHSTTTPKVIHENTYKEMVSNIAKCTDLIKDCQTNSKSCSKAFVTCNEYLIQPVQDTGINVYDAREQCANPPLCGDYGNVKTYLNSDRVKKVLGVKKGWKTCNFAVNGMFHTDWMQNQAGHIPPLLKNGARVLLYAGDVDFICNWMGNKAWSLAMDWKHKKAFNDAPDREWKVNGKSLGQERNANGLTFLRIHKAGHMVPQDQPAAAMEMVNSFIAGETLVSANMASSVSK